MVTTTITLPDDSILILYPGVYNSTYKLRALDFGEYGMAILCEEKDIFEAGKVFYYKSAIHSSDVVSPSILLGDKKRITLPTAEGPIIPNSDKYHYLMGGEMMLVLTSHGLGEPDPVITNAMKNIVFSTLHTEILPSMPRLSHMLDLYSNRGLGHAIGPPETFPQGSQVDYWALHAYRKYYLGGSNPVGYYETVCPEGGDGFGNLHYNIGLWHQLAYVRNPTPQNWSTLINFMLAQAAYGIHYSGTRTGFFRTEKGYGFVGRQKQGTWEKQFAQQMFSILIYTRHPLFEYAINAHRHAIDTTPGNFWGGSWGERIVQLFIQSSYSAYIYFGRPDAIRDKVLIAFADVFSRIDPVTGYIKSREGYTSPWMQFELISAIKQWINIGVGLQYEIRLKDWLGKLMAGTVKLVNGYPKVAYHAYPVDYTDSHPFTHTASLVGALLSFPYMKYEGKTGLEWLPALDAHLGAATPNLNDLGFRNGPEGPGWIKVPAIGLSCLMLAAK